MRALAITMLFTVATACGASNESKPVATAPAASKPVAKPRCPPGSDETPPDAKQKMESLQSAIRKCFTLGTPGKAESVVKVTVAVAESGAVTEAKVVNDTGGHASAVACTEKSLRAAKFARFCGAQVSISWSYALK